MTIISNVKFRQNVVLSSKHHSGLPWTPEKWDQVLENIQHIQFKKPRYAQY